MALNTNVKPKADGKQKVENKPIVENKTEGVPKGKSRKFWILIGSLVLVVIVGLALFAFPYFRGIKDTDLTGDPDANTVEATLALEPFQVNLADTDDLVFVKATFHLGLAEEPDEETEHLAMSAMRDSVISLLSSKKAEEILSVQGKEKLREEIRKRVNTISPDMKVLEVYIVDFIVHL